MRYYEDDDWDQEPPEPPPSPDELAYADAEIDQDDREFAEHGPQA